MKGALVFLLFWTTVLGATCTWSKANLTIARGYMGVAVLEDLGFFAGGEIPGVANSVQSRVDIWNATSQTWSIAELSQARFSMVGTAIPSARIVLFGGGNVGDFNATNVVDIYNLTTRQWSVSRLSQARFDPVATSNGQYAFFAGGLASFFPFTPSNVVDIYDSSTLTWAADRLSQARSAFISQSVGTTVMFAGGVYSNGTGPDDFWPSNVVDIFNVTSKNWSTTTLSVARWGLTATTVNNKVVFASGSIKTDLTTRVDIYDYNTKIWTTAELFEARLWSTAATFKGLGFIIGGEVVDYSRHVTTMEIYNGTAWTVMEMPSGKNELSAIAVKDWLLIAGHTLVNNTIDLYYCPSAVTTATSATVTTTTSVSNRPTIGADSSASLVGFSGVVSLAIALLL